MYGAAQRSYSIAIDRELPAVPEHKAWNRPVAGLLTANVFDLTRVVTLGSSGFLLIFAAVNAANTRRARATRSNAWLSTCGALACLTALAALIWQTARTEPEKLWVLFAMIGLAILIEGVYRLSGKRAPRQSGAEPETRR